VLTQLRLNSPDLEPPDLKRGKVYGWPLLRQVCAIRHPLGHRIPMREGPFMSGIYHKL
jgi:hypothetical protein